VALLRRVGLATVKSLPVIPLMVVQDPATHMLLLTVRIPQLSSRGVDPSLTMHVVSYQELKARMDAMKFARQKRELTDGPTTDRSDLRNGSA
jgi:hypothetical protein